MAVALVLGLVATPLASQQPPQPQQPQPISRAESLGREAGRRFAQTPEGRALIDSLRIVLRQAATHVVEKGETLWSLAEKYYGDPLLWPELYRINTDVVEDPHWVFPGEELRLAVIPEAPAAPAAPAAPLAPGEVTVAPAPSDTAARPAEPSPSGNPFDAPTIFSRKGVVGVSAATLRLRNEEAYRAVRVGEHFSAGFLTEGEHLNPGRLLGNTRTASIRRLTIATSATTFSEVAIAPPPGDTLRPGDLLLSYEVPRILVRWGQVIRPTGLLRVTRVGEPGQNIMAQVLSVYQTITSDQEVIRVQGFQPGRERGVAVDSGIVGSIIDLRDPHELVTIQDVVFIDRGAEDSVHLGDMFQISGTTSASSAIGTVVQNEAKVLIVHLRPHSSTGVIIQIDRPDIQRGATARQIRRTPS